MTRWVLDKNPNSISNDNFDNIKKIIQQNTINSITYTEPFLKTVFLTNLLSSIKNPVIYLDFDLLFSGYIASGIISSNSTMTLLQPTETSWNDMLKNILKQISQEKSTIIIDSINGFYNLFYKIKNVGRLVNSLIMLFVYFSKMSNSHLIITTLVKQKTKDEWVISIIGRHTVETKQMTKIHLDKKNGNLKMTVISNGNNKETHTTLIKSELI
jgi:hypothetical protein